MGLDETVYGNQQCPETIQEHQSRVEAAAVRVRGTPGVFFLSVQTGCDKLKPVLLVKNNIFNICCCKDEASVRIKSRSP